MEQEVSADLTNRVDQNTAEDHTYKGVGECHPYREFEGMQPSRSMQISLASATGVSPWVSTVTWFVTLYFYLNGNGTPKAQGQALLMVQATRGERVPV